MKLTDDQMDFLDYVCQGNKWTLTPEGKVDVDGWVTIEECLGRIPVKFGRVNGSFECIDNGLTTLENCPDYTTDNFYCEYNNLTDYFKNIKEGDFLLWSKLNWKMVLKEYPFLINIGKKYINKRDFKWYLKINPQTKLYLK